MICEHCIYYAGTGFYCFEAHYVEDGLEATNCDDYLYDGDTNE